MNGYAKESQMVYFERSREKIMSEIFLGCERLNRLCSVRFLSGNLVCSSCVADSKIDGNASRDKAPFLSLSQTRHACVFDSMLYIASIC